MNTKLLTRDEFRNGVFERDGHFCVMCKRIGVDAHHIMERRLWPDGGYYLDNGATVCPDCHLGCESTDISVEAIRHAAKVKPILPPHLYNDQIYDKWGNIILPNGQRLRGELFYDESVQKILKKHLHLFTDLVKYPRTHHLPWSEGRTEDDRIISSLDRFIGQRVIVTEKMDGENTTMYNHRIHARSVDSIDHPSRHFVKNFWNYIRHNIPEGWRICGENLYAQHSIAYEKLPSYFMGFSIWTDKNVCLSWDDTKAWFQLLEITPVPVLYDGIYDITSVKTCYGFKSEGYVVRIADSFSYGDFKNVVGKFVRQNHVTTHGHWMRKSIVKNGVL